MTPNEIIEKLNIATNIDDFILPFAAEGDSLIGLTIALIKKQQESIEFAKKFAFDMHIMAVKAEKAEPQYRELSDEEIISIYHDQANRDFQLRFDALKFARAILKKASEK